MLKKEAHREPTEPLKTDLSVAFFVNAFCLKGSYGQMQMLEIMINMNM